MRLVGLFLPAVAAAFVSAAAWAQAWDVYVDRENFFSVNLPGTPTATAPDAGSTGASREFGTTIAGLFVSVSP